MDIFNKKKLPEIVEELDESKKIENKIEIKINE